MELNCQDSQPRYETLINQIKSTVQTPIMDIAKQNLFIYSLLYNQEIEPSHDYTDKFFTILSHEFQKFENDPKKDLILLEASPRTGKTDFVVNLYLTWLLGKKHRHRFLFVASNQKLKDELRNKVQRIVKSPLFQLMFPNIDIVTNNKSDILLSNENGVHFTTTYSTVPIGAGFHYHFYIDFLTGESMRSEAKREEAFSQFKGFASRTQNNPVTKIIIDNQRLGINDLSNYITTQYSDLGVGYIRLTFPYQFEEDYVYNLNGKEILFPKNSYLVSRFNDFEKKKIIARMGHFVYETQYLQKARPPRGDLVQREMFRYYTNLSLENTTFVKGFITTDLALEAKKRNDYNVFIFWLVDDKENLYLIDMFRHKMKGIEAEKALYNFYLKWKDGLSNGQIGCHYMTLENTINTKPTIQKYEEGFFVAGRKVNLGGVIKKLPRVKDKFSRFIDTAPFIQNGQMFLPSYDCKINGVESVEDDIIEPFIREHESFREDDSHDHDDIVDCAIDAINETRKLEIDFSVKF